MNFTQISTFQAVMTSASLSDAATKLGRTQPAVSAAIKALEDQLGLQLFERRGRKLIPVPEAQYLLTEADAILSQLNRVRQTMRSLSDGHSGTLKVAAMPGPVSLIFPKFIASKVSDTEGISISIQARTSNQIAELTRAQSIDFGFADAANTEPEENLYRSVVISADCPVAVPENHPLAQKSEISFADLDDQPLGTLPQSHRQTQDLASRFAAESLSLRATIESQTFLPILHFVAAGRCCTVLDPLSVFLVNADAPMVGGIAIRPMADPIRYYYAIYSPRYRPISVIARNLLGAWQAEVMKLLDSSGFNPRFEGKA
ncbi:LysR family transcriptional regulator [uncultured Tateyamaria sp.]|uniref:LysR family transcriptional regulator n=1 Tax=uncultured Tateyamaria sp. TaxID=455651 RepID=UPI002610466C|nr:LysR family transcriptional regulator [uncultured Tateyamaria sp.]